MRILFIHEVNYRTKVIFEMHEFPELLALRGHDVAFLHYPEAPVHPRVQLRTQVEVVAGRVHPSARLRLITPPTLGGRAWERYLAPILALPALLRELRRDRYDAIVLLAVPTTGWQSVWLARRAHLPLMYRALDVSHLIRRSGAAVLVRRAERFVARNATLLSGNNPAMTQYCVRMSGRTGPSVTNLPPIDLAHFRAAAVAGQAAALRASLGLRPQHKVLVYMGTFFEFSGLDTLLDDLGPYFARLDELRLLLVGGGPMDRRLRAVVSDRGLRDRVIFTGFVPYQQLPVYLGASDVALNPFRRELVTELALPGKVLQYMASGIPVVSTNLRGLRAAVGDESGVTFVPSVHDVAEAAIELAYSDPWERRRIIERQLACIDNVFDRDAAVSDFESAILSMGARLR